MNKKNIYIAGAIAVILVIAAIAYATSRGTSAPVATATSPASTATTSANQGQTATGTPAAKVTTSPLPSIGTTTPSLIYTLLTDKIVYSQSETIHMTIGVSNNTGKAMTFTFPNGCEATYSIDGFNSIDHTRCLQGTQSFTLPPRQSMSFNVYNYPSVYQIPVGGHTITGMIPGYGGASVNVTITK